jgi:predicted transcriptional regulator
MSKTETMTIRVTPEVRQQLEKMALSSRRTKSFLAGEAISRYVASEAKIIEGIMDGMADVAAGQVIPHDKAMKRIRATIAAPRKPQA